MTTTFHTTASSRAGYITVDIARPGATLAAIATLEAAEIGEAARWRPHWLHNDDEQTLRLNVFARAAAAAMKVATFPRMLRLSPATVVQAMPAAASLPHPPGTAHRPAATVEPPSRRAVHTSQSPQPSPTPPRRKPPAGAARR